MSILQTAIDRLRKKINSPLVMISGHASDLSMVASAMEETDNRLQSLEHKYLELLKAVAHVEKK